MNTIIIEKSDPYRQYLGQFINNHLLLHLLGSFKNVLEAYHIIHTHRVDLILVNINTAIPQEVDFSAGIQKRPLVIFFHDSSIHNFNTDNTTIVDCIPTHCDTIILDSAISKAFQHFEHKNTEGDGVFIQSGNSIININESDIFYIKSMQNYVQIATPVEMYTQLIPLKDFHKQLSAKIFVRIHRSYIVNLTKIQEVSRNFVKIQDIELPIGESYRSHFRQLLLSSATIIQK